MSDTIIQFTTAEHWRSMYDDVLVECFPKTELDSFGRLEAELSNGELEAFGVLDEDGNPCSVVAITTTTPVTMVLYLATLPQLRGTGIGARLVAHAVRRAQQRGALIVLAEVEHPDYHPATEYGNPAARLTFYQRLGMRIADVPYFMPAPGPGRERVPALLLGVLWASAQLHHDDQHITASPIAEFLREYFASCEGFVSDDRSLARLFDALRTPQLKLWQIDELDRVPVGTLDERDRFPRPVS